MNTAHLTSLEDKGRGWEGWLVISERDHPATSACDSEGFRPVRGDTLTVGSPPAAPVWRALSCGRRVQSAAPAASPWHPQPKSC